MPPDFLFPQTPLGLFSDNVGYIFFVLQESVVEDTIDIDPKIHRYFMQNNRRVLNSVIDECGGVQISFPPLSSSGGGGAGGAGAGAAAQSSTVRVKGPNDYVKMAKERLAKIVDDLKNQVSYYIYLPLSYSIRSSCTARDVKAPDFAPKLCTPRVSDCISVCFKTQS